LNCSAASRLLVPVAAKLRVPGLALARAMYSFTDLAGSDTATTKKYPPEEICVMG